MRWHLFNDHDTQRQRRAKNMKNRLSNTKFPDADIYSPRLFVSRHHHRLQLVSNSSRNVSVCRTDRTKCMWFHHLPHIVTTHHSFDRMNVQQQGGSEYFVETRKEKREGNLSTFLIFSRLLHISFVLVRCQCTDTDTNERIQTILHAANRWTFSVNTLASHNSAAQHARILISFHSWIFFGIKIQSCHYTGSERNNDEERKKKTCRTRARLGIWMCSGFFCRFSFAAACCCLLLCNLFIFFLGCVFALEWMSEWIRAI